MLVRNLTQSTLNMKSLNGKRISLPSMKIINISELDFPAERIKKLFGRYVQILTEKADEEVPAKPKENLESPKGDNNVPTSDETTTEEQENENNGGENNAPDANTEDLIDDSDNVDELVDKVLEEVEGESSNKEKPAEKKPVEEKQTAKKATKKTGKKASNK